MKRESNNVFEVLSIVSEVSRYPYVEYFMGNLYDYHRPTFFHSLHVAVISVQIGLVYGLSPNRLHHLAAGALLHDIGKIRIPLRILNKTEQLSDEEYDIMKRHPLYSYDMIHSIKCDISPIIELTALMHHQHVDFTGYPSPGEAPPGTDFTRLPTEARIVSVADVYHAIISPRAYKESLSGLYAIGELYRAVDRHHVDVRFVKILCDLVSENQLALCMDCSSLFHNGIPAGHDDN